MLPSPRTCSPPLATTCRAGGERLHPTLTAQRSPEPLLWERSPGDPSPVSQLLTEHAAVLVMFTDWEQAAAAVPAGDLPWLLDGELQRYRSLRTERARRRLAASRALAVLTAGRLLDVPPGAVRLAAQPSGRPCLVGARGNIWNVDVSVSHTGDTLLLAFASGRRIGVDLEHASRPIATLNLAPLLCSPGESRHLERLPASSRNDYLLRLWTVKESFGKALGVGLGLDFPTVEFALRCDRALRVPGDGCAAGALDWRHLSFPAPGGHWAALSLGPPVPHPHPTGGSPS